MNVTIQELNHFAEMLSGKNVSDIKDFLVNSGLCSVNYERGKVYERKDFKWVAVSVPVGSEMLVWEEGRALMKQKFKHTVGCVNEWGKVKTQIPIPNWTHAMILE